MVPRATLPSIYRFDASRSAPPALFELPSRSRSGEGPALWDQIVRCAQGIADSSVTGIPQLPQLDREHRVHPAASRTESPEVGRGFGRSGTDRGAPIDRGPDPLIILLLRPRVTEVKNIVPGQALVGGGVPRSSENDEVAVGPGRSDAPLLVDIVVKDIGRRRRRVRHRPRVRLGVRLRLRLRRRLGLGLRIDRRILEVISSFRKVAKSQSRKVAKSQSRKASPDPRRLVLPLQLICLPCSHSTAAPPSPASTSLRAVSENPVIVSFASTQKRVKSVSATDATSASIAIASSAENAVESGACRSGNSRTTCWPASSLT